MGNVVQSDVKGIQLFLNELDKGEQRAADHREEARVIANDKFKKDVTLGQMGLEMDQNGKFVPISAGKNAFLQGKMNIQRNAAVAEQNLGFEIDRIEKERELKNAQNPINQVIQGLKNKATTKQNKFENEQNVIKKFTEAKGDLEIGETEVGKKIRQKEKTEKFENAAITAAGGAEGIRPSKDAAKLDKLQELQQTQLRTLKGLSGNMEGDFDEAVNTIIVNGPMDEGSFDKLIAEGFKKKIKSNEDKKAKTEILDEIEKLSGKRPREETPEFMLKIMAEKMLEEKPSGVTNTEFNHFNSDIKGVVENRAKSIAINSFLKSVDEGKAATAFGVDVSHDSDIDIPPKLRGFYPKLFEGVTSIDMGNTDIINTLKAEKEVALAGYAESSKSVNRRAETQPNFKEWLDRLTAEGKTFMPKKKK